MITPIIVFGDNRNGTTNFLNHLSEKKEIFTLTHKYHWGYHSINVLGMALKFNEIKTVPEYIRFIAEFKESDFFKILAIDENLLYKQRFNTFYNMFLYLMDEAAKKHSCKYWMVKLSPAFAEHKNEYVKLVNNLNKYKDVRWLGIVREPISVINSSLNMPVKHEGKINKIKNLRLKQIIKSYKLSFAYIIHRNFYKSEIKKHGGVLVDFKEFVNNTESQLLGLYDYIGLDNKEIELFTKSPINSSFYGKESIVKLTRKSIKRIYSFASIIYRIFKKTIEVFFDKENKKRDIRYYRKLNIVYWNHISCINNFKDDFMKELEVLDKSTYTMLKEKIDAENIEQ